MKIKILIKILLCLMLSINTANALHILDDEKFIAPTLMVKSDGDPLYYTLDQYIRSMLHQDIDKVGSILPILVKSEDYKYGNINASCIVYHKYELDKIVKTKESPVLNVIYDFLYVKQGYKMDKFTQCVCKNKNKSLALFEKLPIIHGINMSIYTMNENSQDTSAISILKSQEAVILYIFSK